jgi:hypothetical protein
MKKHYGNGKKAAANDKPEAKPVERYVIGSTDTVKRGFLKELCDFTRKKGTVDVELLVAEFSGRQIDRRKIDAARVRRYIQYCVNHGQSSSRSEWHVLKRDDSTITSCHDDIVSRQHRVEMMSGGDPVILVHSGDSDYPSPSA